MDGIATTSAAHDLFALTDEQILGMEPEAGAASGSTLTDEQLLEDAGTSVERGAEERDGSKEGTPGAQSRVTVPQEGTSREEALRDSGQAGVSVPQAPPPWLAERMRDPWNGEEAKELWESTLQARQEATAYREAIATPAEARALKELYPGGVTEAKSAAERARQLEEFDGAYFGVAGKPPEELSAARVQLAQRLMEQDPAAFREMVAAGVRLLERRGQSAVNREERQDVGGKPGSLDSGLQNTQTSARDDNNRTGREAADIAGKGRTP